MKKILFVALGATLLAAGCQKTEIINPVGDKIGFSSEMGKLTKAETAGDLTTLKSQNFKVWAYTAYEDDLNGVERGQLYDGINGLEIKFDQNASTENQWVTADGKDYYWPGKEFDLDFYGVSTTKTVTVDIVSDGAEELGDRVLTVKGYVANPNVATDDLMVANFVRQNQTDKDDKSVSMRFNHALSKVTFAFKTAGDKQVSVSKIEVLGLTTSGNLEVTEAPKDYDDATMTSVKLEWKDSDGEFGNKMGDYVREFTGDDAILGKSDHVPFTTWLVIPQELTNKTVKIYYSIGEKNFTHVFSLESSSLENGWEVNQSITYNVTLSPNTISFVPSVQPWEEKAPVTEVN